MQVPAMLEDNARQQPGGIDAAGEVCEFALIGQGVAEQFAHQSLVGAERLQIGSDDGGMTSQSSLCSWPQ